MNPLLNWVESHALISGVAIVSTGLLVLSILATPWLVCRLPENYLLDKESRATERTPLRIMLLLMRTIVGCVFIVLGVVMLVTPGPGLIMLLLGVSMAEFPGKRRLFLFIATRPAVFSSLNWIRNRRNTPPFEHP